MTWTPPGTTVNYERYPPLPHIHTTTLPHFVSLFWQLYGPDIIDHDYRYNIHPKRFVFPFNLFSSWGAGLCKTKRRYAHIFKLLD